MTRRHDWKRCPARLCEHRAYMPYDEQDVGHVIHPNGSMIGSLDRQFLGGATRLVLEIHDQAKARP